MTEINPHGKKIAEAEQLRMRERYAELNKHRANPIDLTEDHKYGFTFVCNNCGSIQVRMGQVYREQRHDGTQFDCQDCGQEVEYV